MNNQRSLSVALFVASMVPAPLPPPPAEMFKRKPSGKNRDKIKAARKQRRRGN